MQSSRYEQQVTLSDNHCTNLPFWRNLLRATKRPEIDIIRPATADERACAGDATDGDQLLTGAALGLRPSSKPCMVWPLRAHSVFRKGEDGVPLLWTCI